MTKKTKSQTTESAADVLKHLWTDVAKAEATGDFDRAFKILSKVLAIASNDPTALHCKIVCLVQLGKFEDAIQFIAKRSEPEIFVFEKAYCEYRLGRNEQALITLGALDADTIDSRCLELRAQLEYKLERYSECLETYKQLIRLSSDEFDEERQINILAVLAQLGLGGSGFVDMSSEESYDFCINKAAVELGSSNPNAAIRSLDTAERLCRETMDEEEIGEDIALIRTQKAYALQLLGRSEDAVQMYTEVLQDKPDDPAVCAVAANNLVSLRGSGNVWDSRKRMKACVTKDAVAKLNSKQQLTALLTNTMLSLHGNQLDACRKGLTELEQKQTYPEETVLLGASLLVRQRKVQDAILKLQKSDLIESSQRVRLALAQLQLQDSRLGECLRTLEPLISHSAILSVCVHVYIQMENREQAIALLQKASETPDQRTKQRMLEEMARLHIESGDNRSAGKWLEKLRALSPTDPIVMSRLIKAYAQYDLASAEKLCGQMEAPDVDVDALEGSSWMALGGKYVKRKKQQQEATEKGDVAQKTKHKRKRQVRLPKNIDLNVAPDPERWLPRFERSDFKKRKNKRQRERDIARGPQGAAVDAGLDQSTKTQTAPAGAANAAAAKPPGAAQPAAGPRQQRPGGAKPKKKGKGKKW